MDNIRVERLLYRILQGRLRIKVGDLVLYYREPFADQIEESLDIYEDAYNEAYYQQVPLLSEVEELLIDNGLWSPADEDKITKFQKDIEEIKLQIFERFYDKRQRMSLKMQLRSIENILVDLLTKKHLLDHTSCEGAAKFARNMWFIENCTLSKDLTPYQWEEIKITDVFEIVQKGKIEFSELRAVSLSSQWRNRWSATKHIKPFDREPKDWTEDQLSLANQSGLLDNIYENPDAPKEEIIKDDDAIEGWLIKQRRKRDSEKKKKEAENAIGNSKIANSDEVFIMARDEEAAKGIHDMNNPIARKIMQNRNKQIREAGDKLDFRQLNDIKQDIATQSVRQSRDAIKTRGRSGR